MNQRSRAIFLQGFSAALFGLALAGCGPSEPAVPELSAEEQATAEHEKFFGAAAKEPGIEWRSSGLGIRILAPGQGASPQLADRVRVQYVGKLKDGHVFDDSHLRGAPSDFFVNQLIPGWAAAMPSLKVGGRAEFFIPPSLGYGGMKRGDIPAVSGLIFNVELLAINPEDAKPKPAAADVDPGLKRLDADEEKKPEGNRE